MLTQVLGHTHELHSADYPANEQSLRIMDAAYVATLECGKAIIRSLGMSLWIERERGVSLSGLFNPDNRRIGCQSHGRVKLRGS